MDKEDKVMGSSFKRPYWPYGLIAIFALTLILVGVFGFLGMRSLRVPGETPQVTSKDELMRALGIQLLEEASAPSFTLSDLNGKPTSLTDFKGNLVLLNFWATWCGPCVEETPSLERLHSEYKDQGLVLLAVAIQSDIRSVENFVREMNLSFRVLIDEDGSVFQNYGLFSVPTTFFIGKDGKIIGKRVGAMNWATPQMLSLISLLLSDEQRPLTVPSQAESPPAEIDVRTLETVPLLLGFSIAFLLGILYFISPCVLPLVPSYLSYITGMSFQELTATQEKARSPSRRLAIIHSLLFIVGFSIFFVVLGASASLAGHFLREHRDVVRIGGGILIIIFGLIISGILRIPFLMRDWRIRFKEKPTGFLGSFLVGLTFSAGWTACGAPLLGSILALSSQTATVGRGVFFLSGFSLGLALPFFLSAVALTSFLSFFTKFRKFIGLVEKISGALLILVGLLLLTNSFNLLVRYFSKLLP